MYENNKDALLNVLRELLFGQLLRMTNVNHVISKDISIYGQELKH